MGKYEITSGKIAKAQKIVIYGPEGIGKSTFLSRFPGVAFIDIEGSTANMDVRRLPKPSSWTMLIDEITAVRNGDFPGIGTLAIDTADWAEILCDSHVCTSHKVTGIEDFGYGKGYTYAEEEFGKMLNLLQEIVDRGTNVTVAAHAQMRKFEQPDEQGAYDRWELKLDKRTASLLKEWSDMLLFATYETFVIKGKTAMDKNKVQGGQRIIYTTHHPCWDAKNRFDLPEKINMDFSEIARCIPNSEIGAAISRAEAAGIPVTVAADEKPPLPDPPPAAAPEPKSDDQDWTEEKPIDIPWDAPKALTDMMIHDGVSEKELMHVVASRGYYPEHTPISKYDPEFIDGVLVAAWEQIKNMVIKLRESEGESHEY